ncbi:MAG: glycoside hydrolase family 3 protein [Treponema sp.]|jgi:beta-N-acetylhexosaminidase|nr:glycoside hydrolase family 3 protein [Treponema sp.]
MKNKTFFTLLLFLLLFSCTAKTEKALIPEPVSQSPVSSGQFELEQNYHEQAARIASSLDDRLLASQVIIAGIDGKTHLNGEMRALLWECPVGGIMLFSYNIAAKKEQIKRFLSECSNWVTEAGGARLEAQGIPVFQDGSPQGALAQGTLVPFIAVDHEGGPVHRFGNAAEKLPAPFSYWGLAQCEGIEKALVRIEEDSFRSANEIRDLGITMNFAPVAEFLTGENSLFLEDRSYGPDPVFTAAASAAFIRGMEKAGVTCVVKHFPGNAGPDPHKSPSVLEGDRAALDFMVSPFAALIHDVPALMISHSVVPAWDNDTNASLSHAIMGDWLRGELGYQGIIITDDFSMGAVKNTGKPGAGIAPGRAAVKALIAGADMVLTWPPDIRKTHREIMAALASGEISRERLREAAERIIFEKIRRGLINAE